MQLNAAFWRVGHLLLPNGSCLIESRLTVRWITLQNLVFVLRFSSMPDRANKLFIEQMPTCLKLAPLQTAGAPSNGSQQKTTDENKEQA